MNFRFGRFELDVAQHELRLDGAACELQRQPFEVLRYLLEHRERVVPKDELLEAVWRDVNVTEGSLQRAVSLVRNVLREGGADDGVRTFAGRGYRFTAPVDARKAAAAGTAVPPRYVERGGVSIAHQVVGSGPPDIVLVQGWALSMQSTWDEAACAARNRRLARLGRLILFDKRGTGLSDRVKTPDLDDRIDDLRAVLDALSADRVVLVGISEGAPMAILYAAIYPERVQSLVLVGGFARMGACDDHPWGWDEEATSRLARYIEKRWGEGRTIAAAASHGGEDPAFLAWAAQTERTGASPGAARDLFEMNLAIDVRPLLPSVQAPTLVAHSLNDAVIPVGAGRYLADRIPRAQYLELPGNDHLLLGPSAERFHSALEDFLAADRAAPAIEGSVLTLLAVGDGTALTDAVAEAFRSVVERYGGALAAGPAALASFQAPARAIRCACAVASTLANGGGAVGFGLHTAEVSRRGGALEGVGVAAAQRVASLAPAGDVWVSRTVADLVAGSGLSLEARSEEDLPGLLGPSALYGVVAGGA